MNLKTIPTPNKIKDRISARLPQQIIQQRDAGRNQTLSYISGSTVIDILNVTFGHLGWDFTILDRWMQECTPWTNKYKDNSVEEQNPVAFVHGRLTVRTVDENGNFITVVKESFGSKSVIGKQNEQESTFKSAQTDALKKCASLLGIGAELYRKSEEQEYYDSLTTDPTWSDEMIEKYNAQYSYITELIEAGHKDYVDQCVAYLTGRESATWEYIPEETIQDLLNMVQEAMEEA
jgi:hypothetical protein